MCSLASIRRPWCDNRHGRARLMQPDDRQPVIADKRDAGAIGRKLRIVAGSEPGKPNLHSRAVVQIVKPQPPVGIEQQVRRVGRPKIARHVVARTMVAVSARRFLFSSSGAILAALTSTWVRPVAGSTSISSPPSRYVRWFPSGDQVQLVRERADERSMAVDRLYRQRLPRRLRGNRTGCERKQDKNQSEKDGSARQRGFLLKRNSQRDSSPAWRHGRRTPAAPDDSV